MNSWERMITSLELEIPDKIPLFEMHPSRVIASKVLGGPSIAYDITLRIQLISEGRDVEKLNRRIAEEVIKFHKKLELDYIRVIGGIPKKIHIKKINSNIWLINNVKYKFVGESLWNIDILSQSYDLNDILSRVRSKPPEPADEIFEVLRYISKEVKGELFLSFDADGSWGPIVSNPRLLICVLKWIYTKPYVVRLLIEYFTNYAIKLGKKALDEGADAIMMCVDYGHSKGPWLSPRMFREFIKPALEKQVNAFKRKGGFTILHSDGNIWPLLPDIIDTGLDAYQGIDVEAGMNLAKVKEFYGDKICLIGNFDPRVIEFGSRADILNEVKRCLNQGAPGGGYVFSTSANASICLNVDNFILMLNYVKKRRSYQKARI